MNQAEVTRLLKLRYPAPEYAFLPQTRNSTGLAGIVRTADALAMSLWPSRGLGLHGFEIKSRRSDWLSELKSPSKAEPICQFCDYWWLVAGDEKVVKPDEVPPTWGLLVAESTKLAVVKAAPKLEPQPITRDFLASILRKASEVVVSKADIDAELRAKYEDGYKQGQDSGKRHAANSERIAQQLQEKISFFESVSGVNICSYDRANIAKAVRFVKEGGLEAARSSLIALSGSAKEIGKRIDDVLSEMEQLRGSESAETTTSRVA